MICPACQYKLHNASQNCAGICCRVKQPCNHEGKLNQTTKVCHNGLCAFLCEGPQIEWITVSGAMEQETTQCGLQMTHEAAARIGEDLPPGPCLALLLALH